MSNCAKADELPEILEQLLQLAPEKYLDYYIKLHNLINQLADHAQLIKIFCNEIKTEDPDRKYQALKHLLNIFMKNRELANLQYKDEFLECLEVGIQDRNHLHHLDICCDYLKLLNQKGRVDELTRAAENMTGVYTNNVIPLEWICKVYIENESFAISENLKSNFGIYVERLLELNPSSVLGLMASGLVKFAIGDLPAAREILTKGKKNFSEIFPSFFNLKFSVNNLQPNWSTCLRKLVAIHQKLRSHLLAELVLRQLKDCDVDLAESLIEQQIEKKTKEGKEILEQRDDVRSLELLARADIYSKDFEGAEKLIKKLNIEKDETKVLQAKLHRARGEAEEAVKVLQGSESHEAFLELGQILFEQKNYDDSLLNILKATKLDSNDSECFYWLGKIYVTISDEVRSRKCFEKCLNLNPQNEKAIAILSAVYRKNNDWDQNLALLENSVKSVDGHHQKSAFLQLGLHHLGQQSYDNAITAFRNSLKYDTTNAKCWESLADSYFGRGSYTSALKVFEKSVELNPENTYAKLQIAKIKFILQQFRESIADYEALFKSTPDYLPALKGIAESHFGRAFYLHENHRTGRARDHCQEALNYLQQAIQAEPTFLCLWRMLANVLEFVGHLPELHAHLTVPAALICEAKPRKLTGEELAELAGKCYSRCLKLNRDDDLLWFELVANYYKRARKFGNGENFMKLAFEGAKHLVRLAPSRWQNWNLLGVIAATKEIDDPALTQHCFIRAINLDKKTYTSWSNLGAFYLTQGDIKLANKAFSRAQQSDTTFLNAWIGQAIIAELIGDRDEAMDLFRHCTQLGFHQESSIAYPNFVCSVLDEPDYASVPKYEYAIDRMFAVPLALDNIMWNTLMTADATFEAWSYVGYLSSCQGLWNQAIDAYQKAAKLADGQKKDKTLTDLGYCFLKAGKNAEAAEAFNDVKDATFKPIIGLALAFYKAGRFEECYETYQKAIEWLASSDEEKAVVLVAMAAMVYAFQGVDDAKMVLFQW